MGFAFHGRVYRYINTAINTPCHFCIAAQYVEYCEVQHVENVEHGETAEHCEKLSMVKKLSILKKLSIV